LGADKQPAEFPVRTNAPGEPGTQILPGVNRQVMTCGP